MIKTLTLLANEYALEVKQLNKTDNGYIITWTDYSYKLGAMKFRWHLTHLLKDIATVVSSDNSLEIYNFSTEQQIIEVLEYLRNLPLHLK